MRRPPLIYHRSRANIKNLLALMQADGEWSTDKWPAHLKSAYKLLRSELNVPAEQARAIVISGIQFAHKCSLDLTEMAAAHEREILCRHGARYFNKVAINLERLPARLRHAVKDLTLRLTEARAFDTEMLDALLDGIASQLVPHATLQSDAERTLKTIYCDPRKEEGDRIWDRRPPPLADLYSGVHPIDRTRAEIATNALLSSEQRISAGELFRCIATTLAKQVPKKRRAVFKPIVEFVEKTAELWRAHGLAPTRGNNPRIPNYRGPFHRFTDLLLTAMTEPESRRGHAGTGAESRRDQERLANIREQIYSARNALPPDIRRLVSASLPRRDTCEIVSDDHIRKALSRSKR